MIYSLRKKFIRICAVSLIAVLSCIFIAIYFISTEQLNSGMDTLTDAIASNDGRFPEFSAERYAPPSGLQRQSFITPESQFSTRFFTVRIDTTGKIIGINTEQISSVSYADAVTYAERVADGGIHGWMEDYRYKRYATDFGQLIVFVDGSVNRSMSHMFLLTAAVVLFGSGLIVLLLIVFFSKRAVKPVAESYEKQKQFITDANHELKTPLTLILTNLDIAESEVGKNEWLEDIRSEGKRMSDLVNRLVTLSRMDEDPAGLRSEAFSLTDTALDIVSEFQPLASERGKKLLYNVEPSVHYCGDEAAIRQLLAILLDNAVKYCDEEGTIFFRLEGRRHPTICVENTFCEVNATELERLFDRFYRSDKARTAGTGYGIGLSIARAITEKHHGSICAYRKDSAHIGFKAVLK